MTEGNGMAGDVAVGVIYARRDAPHLRWVVAAATKIDGIPYVYLERLGDPSDIKLLAATAVADERDYKRISSMNPAGSVGYS